MRCTRLCSLKTGVTVYQSGVDLADLVEEADVVDAGGVGEVQDAGESPVHDVGAAEHLGGGGRVGGGLDDDPDDGRAKI
jgi:hypothetical protein